MRKARSLADQAAYLQSRKIEVGLDVSDFEKAKNSGARRTPEKRALLSLLEERAVAAGRSTPFKSNY